MKKLRFLIRTILFCLLAGSVLTSCAADKENNADMATSSKVVVGSKSFTESNLLAEIYSLALEENGYTVERKFNIAGSVIHQAITNDEIDVYPEYTGTALISTLKGPVMMDDGEVYDYVEDAYAKQFDLIWLKPSALNDSQGLVIRTSAAQQYGITDLSGLQQNAAKLRFASQGDFDEREDGLPALEAVYGPFEFKSSTVFDDSLKYDVLSSGQADVAVAYTTEGNLADEQFTLLKEDKQVWPPYEAAPVIRKSVLDKYSNIRDILNAVSENLTTEAATKMNARVDIDKEEMEEVALDFFGQIKDKVVIHS